MDTILIALLALGALCIFLAVRNAWTYRERVALIYRDFDAYQKLPGYYTCFFKFWIWDITKF